MLYPILFAVLVELPADKDKQHDKQHKRYGYGKADLLNSCWG
jgi:hypothetical protein